MTHFTIKTNGTPTILVEQGINHIERCGTQYFGLCSLRFYVVQHKICQSTKQIVNYAFLTPEKLRRNQTNFSYSKLYGIKVNSKSVSRIKSAPSISKS